MFIPDPKSVFMPEALVCSSVMPGNALFFDTHMHIQSNNCVPLPLQWGMVKKVAKLMRPDMLSREGLNLVSATRNRFGAIGVFATDLIAGVYFGTGVVTGGTNNREPEKVWEKIKSVPGDISNYLAEKKLLSQQTEDSLKLLVQGSNNAFPEFEKTTHYYFRNNRVKRIAVCHLMDMSYSHFWGTNGLPINIPLGNAAVFINDFITAGPVQSKLPGISSSMAASFVPKKKYADFTSMTENTLLSTTMPGWTHLFAAKCPEDSFSFKDQYRNFFKTTTTSLDEKNISQDAFIAFSTDPETRALDERLIQKKYVHIVEDLPASEVKLFENYDKQKLRTIKAAMTWPLQLLPFFHFDPRRHVSAEKRASLLDNLERDHAFYRISVEHPFIRLTPDEAMNSKAFMSGIISKLSDVDAARKELFLDPSSTTGVFWGVKIYPRLGYAPADVDRYPQLDAIYATCQVNQIPITAHCAREPMCIPDYINYSRYDHKNKKPPSARSQDAANYVEHEFWFADNFTTAANWEKVLDKYPDLKVDLAHFGGMDLWVLFGGVKGFDGEFATLEKYFDANPGKMPKEEKPKGTPIEMQEQLASLYWAWVKKTAILCQTKKNVYTHLACFVLPDQDEKGINGVSKMELVAKNLAMLINMYPKLKDKILVGSDWFMAEEEGTVGVGSYFSNLFKMLRMVSDLVEPKFDAWHQFALINPLKFLGLWKEGGRIDVEKCEKYVERLAGWVGEFVEYSVNYNYEQNVLSDTGKQYKGYLFNIGKDEYLWCETIGSLTDVKWHLTDRKFTNIRQTKLTDELTKMQLASFGFDTPVFPAKRRLIGYTETQDKPNYFSVHWNQDMSEFKIEPIIYQIPQNGCFSEGWFLSDDESWLVITHFTFYDETKQIITFYHIDDKYPQGISLPVFGQETLYEKKGCFLNHSVHGPLYLDWSPEFANTLLVYRLNDVLKVLAAKAGIR